MKKVKIMLDALFNIVYNFKCDREIPNTKKNRKKDGKEKMKAKMKKVLMKEIDRVSYPFVHDVNDDRKKQLELVYCCQNMVNECFYKQGVLTISEYYMIDGLLFQVSTLLENNLCQKEDIKNISKQYLIKID